MRLVPGVRATVALLACLVATALPARADDLPVGPVVLTVSDCFDVDWSTGYVAPSNPVPCPKRLSPGARLCTLVGNGGIPADVVRRCTVEVHYIQLPTSCLTGLSRMELLIHGPDGEEIFFDLGDTLVAGVGLPSQATAVRTDSHGTQAVSSGVVEMHVLTEAGDPCDLGTHVRISVVMPLVFGI